MGSQNAAVIQCTQRFSQFPAVTQFTKSNLSSHTVYSVIQPSSYTMTGDQINSSASKYLEFWFKKCTKIEEYHGIAGIYQRTMDDSWTKEPLEVIQGRKN